TPHTSTLKHPPQSRQTHQPRTPCALVSTRQSPASNRRDQSQNRSNSSEDNDSTAARVPQPIAAGFVRPSSVSTADGLELSGKARHKLPCTGVFFPAWLRRAVARPALSRSGNVLLFARAISG